MSEEKTPTKSEMLAQIEETRAHLVSLISRLSEAQMTEAGVQDAWSIKDMLAHIAAWERLTLDRLEAAFLGRPLGYKLIRSDRDVDEMNARVYEQNKDRPLAEVLAEFEGTHRNIMGLIHDLGESEFAGPIPAGWAHGKPVWEMIGGNTCWHYSEHSEAIEAWLKGK